MLSFFTILRSQASLELNNLVGILLAAFITPCGWPTFLLAITSFVSVNFCMAYTARPWVAFYDNLRRVTRVITSSGNGAARDQLVQNDMHALPRTCFGEKLELWVKPPRVMIVVCLVSLAECVVAAVLYTVAATKPSYDLQDAECAFKSQMNAFKQATAGTARGMVLAFTSTGVIQRRSKNLKVILGGCLRTFRW